MNKEIDKYILDNNNIISKRSSLLIPLIIFAAACISFAIAIGMENENSSKMPILLIAVILVVIAVIKLLFGEKTMVYKPTGEHLIKKELFYERNEMEKVLELIAKENIDTLLTKAKSNENLPIKVDIYATESNSIAICRAYNFVPYTYEAITEYTVIKK